MECTLHTSTQCDLYFNKQKRRNFVSEQNIGIGQALTVKQIGTERNLKIIKADLY